MPRRSGAVRLYTSVPRPLEGDGRILAVRKRTRPLPKRKGGRSRPSKSPFDAIAPSAGTPRRPARVAELDYGRVFINEQMEVRFRGRDGESARYLFNRSPTVMVPSFSKMQIGY